MKTLRILLIEDNPDEAALIHSILDDGGIACDVARVENRAAFIAYVEKGDFDMILADYKLPSFDGVSALAIAQEKLPEAPFIFVSGKIDEELAIECLKKGATDYVFKRRLSRLVPTVKRALKEAEEKARRQDAEEKLRDSEFKFRSIIEGIGEGVMLIDRDFRIIMSNKSCCDLTAKDKDALIGRHCYEVSHHYSKPCYEMGEKCSVKQTFETGFSHRIVHTHFDEDSRPSHIETISYPLKDSEGNIMSAIEVLTDVTVRVNLETEVKRRIKELEEFYDMAVGRELRMVALKDEIERLRKQLAKQERS